MTRSYKDAPYFEVRYGNCSFSTGTAKINAWIVEADTRTFPSKVLAKTRPSHTETAHREGYTDHGKWMTDYLEAKPGTLIFLTVYSTRRRVPTAQAGIILRVRDGAPVNQVKVRVTSSPDARYEELPIFVGRADIMTYQQAKREYGLKFNKNVVSHWLEDEEEFEETFIIDELSPARSGPPKVMQIEREGEVQTVTVDNAPRRRITTRRKKS